MEAETYLSSGYGIRQAIEAKPNGWTPFSQVARAWMPGRLKGIQVSREFGTPFLAATQVFDVRPVPRKWLSLERTSDVKNRFVAQGTILVTCSGAVGRPTSAYGPLERTLISHDLLRIEPLEERNRGWVYAYLHSPQTRAMATGTHYGHIIKHLETTHIDALPIPEIDDSGATDFNRRLAEILKLRNDGYRLTLEAEAVFREGNRADQSERLGRARLQRKGFQGLHEWPTADGCDCPQSRCCGNPQAPRKERLRIHHGF